MTTMQEKLTAQFQTVVTDFKNEDLEFVTAPAYANTGTWHVMDGLDTLATVSYDFQPHRASFIIGGPLAQQPPPERDYRWHEITGSRDHGYHYLTEYVKGEDLRRPLDTLRRLLTTWRAEVASGG
jgi:hypothetical protein